MARKPPPPPPERLPAPEAAKEALDNQLSGEVVIVDATHRTITRALVDKILANPRSVAKGARLVPAVKDGKPEGFKIYAIQPSSVFARLGLLNGDTLTAVNGFDLTTAEKALEVYTKLREATSLEVDLVRGGKPIKLLISVIK